MEEAGLFRLFLWRALIGKISRIIKNGIFQKRLLLQMDGQNLTFEISFLLWGLIVRSIKPFLLFFNFRILLDYQNKLLNLDIYEK